MWVIINSILRYIIVDRKSNSYKYYIVLLIHLPNHLRNEMKLKKSKKKKECYSSFQPIGNVDRYNSGLFAELKKPFTYLYGQAYCPMLFVFVSSSLQMHAVVCRGDQEDVIRKVSE